MIPQTGERWTLSQGWQWCGIKYANLRVYCLMLLWLFTAEGWSKYSTLKPRSIQLKYYTTGILQCYGVIALEVAHYNTNKVEFTFFFIETKTEINLGHLFSERLDLTKVLHNNKAKKQAKAVCRPHTDCLVPIAGGTVWATIKSSQSAHMSPSDHHTLSSVDDLKASTSQLSTH